MRLRQLSCAALLVPLFALGCSDNNPTYPAIVIYGNTNGTGAGNATGAGNSTGAGNNTGSGNASSGGGSNSNAGSNGNPNDPFAHCDNMWSGEDPPVGKTECDMDALTDDGELSGDVTADRTLTSGHSYRIKGSLRVMPGVTLTIEPCVKVMGESSEAVLAVLSGGNGNPNEGCRIESGTPVKGGKLMAVGEPMAPIVFTSSKPVGSRAPGDWGGVILMGKAINNGAGADDGGREVPIEGLARSECHGWYDDTYNEESSGSLQYVRIEYASRQFRADSETNGLTLASLGSGTELHYIMVSNSADDCYEWFGGTANADHLIALNCEDDMFDGDQGFSGKLQFLFGRQFPTTTEIDSRGFEIDGAAMPLEGTGLPYTSEHVSNFTVCGGGATDMNSSRDGAVLRKFASEVSLENGIVTGFAGSGLFVQTGQQSSDGALMTFTQVFGNTSGIAAAADASGGGGVGVPQEWFVNQQGNTSAEPDRFCNCWANPPVPVAANTGVGTPPTGFDDATAAYKGAFKDASANSNWMRGAWVDWSAQ